MKLVIATRNRKKGEEMFQLLAPPWEPNARLAGLRIETLDDHPAAPEVVEDADTFAGNAQKKAVETARALGCWVVADDSGLAVDALGGAPGVYSARYAGTHGDDAANALSGAAGNDQLRGGAGDDLLSGGSGADRLYFDSALGVVVLYLPFLQARFARDNRLRAYRELRTVRHEFRRAPVVFLIAP